MESDLANDAVVDEQPREERRIPIVKSNLVKNAWAVYEKFKEVPDEHLPHPYQRIIRYEGEREGKKKITQDRSRQAHGTAARLRSVVPKSWPPGLWQLYAEVELDPLGLEIGLEQPTPNSKLFLRLVKRQDKAEFLPAEGNRGFQVDLSEGEDES